MHDENIKKVCINNNCFKVEIADNQEKWSKGLMERENLDKDRGMLFVFDQEAVHSFWMKNTLIALDIIWINKDKEIIYIEENALPCKTENCQSYGPNQNSKYVLEINAGLAEKLKINPVDKLVIKNI